eukprot:354351-Chlamydomonas_euryale.AAC.1
MLQRAAAAAAAAAATAHHERVRWAPRRCLRQSTWPQRPHCGALHATPRACSELWAVEKARAHRRTRARVWEQTKVWEVPSV